jgi:hypothetical protein
LCSNKRLFPTGLQGKKKNIMFLSLKNLFEF